MKIQGSLFTDSYLTEIKELVYDICGFDLSQISFSTESKEYAACNFMLNGRSVIYRVAKITPTKHGQFVTIWQRDNQGIIQPFDIKDDISYIVVTTKNGDNFGQFVFPKKVLIEKGILSQIDKKGKLAIRVYPPWDILSSSQAIKTQLWQNTYFLDIGKNGYIDVQLAKLLYFI